jgi:ribA/ribD-fused uncharacterized protein
MKYSVEKLALDANAKDHQYIFFWGHTPSITGEITKACMSQWWSSSFTVDGHVYKTAEHYMMAQKALLFDDHDVFERILEESNPANVKKLGREVKNFDVAVWNDHCYMIVVEGNFQKFYQNKDLQLYLLSTHNAILVEASPFDAIWGIGTDAYEKDVNLWKGKNYLGFAIMEARDKIRLEAVAEDIHKQWQEWAKELLTEEPELNAERKSRWMNECMMDYNALSESMKDLDRKYANIILNTLNFKP